MEKVQTQNHLWMWRDSMTQSTIVAFTVLHTFTMTYTNTRLPCFLLQNLAAYEMININLRPKLHKNII